METLEPNDNSHSIEKNSVNETPSSKNKGVWLTLILILMFFGNAFTALAYFGNADAIMQAYPIMSKTLISFMGLLALANIVFTIAIWNWRKVGVSGICFSMALAFVINLYIGIGLAGALTGLIGGVVLFLTIRKKWQHFS